jgi:hypothetical protein
MVKHMRFSRESVMAMPVYERRIHLDMWQKEMEEQKQQYERASRKKK